jgi:hypothetical protein
MEAHNSKPQHLNLAVKANLIARFLKFIELGFKLKIKAGLSIRELLCVHLGISDNYFENRIQTIFLDGMPVDNVDTAWVDDGARIALSAAMPGLAGATFRKDGPYASLRGTISYSKGKKTPVRGEATINLKFFNMIAKELGPVFLQKGIMVEGNTFQNFVLRNADDLKAACTLIYLNDEKVDIVKLVEMNWKNTEIFLQVTSEETG